MLIGRVRDEDGRLGERISSVGNEYVFMDGCVIC